MLRIYRAPNGGTYQYEEGEQPDGYVEVTFDDLEVRAYEAQGKVQFTAKAADIHAV